MARDLGDDLAPRFDLDQVPYTVRFSRLLVKRGTAGLDVFRAAYERSMADSVVVGGLRLLDATGDEVPVEAVTPLRITFRGGASLIVTPEGCVHLGGLPTGWSVVADLSLPVAEAAVTAERLLLPADAEVLAADAVTTVRLPSGGEVSIACNGSVTGSHDAATESVARDLAEWFGRCPPVAEGWREVTRFCWWVLGVNTLRLDAPDGLNRAVVPSKIGYVGLWQWDAYFIAIGLRHGDPGLAAEQMRIALAHPTPDGQLPDVVHERGILASSDDLPPSDLEALRRLGSPSLAHASVPLTKPPLTALAVQLLAEQCGDDVVDAFLDAMLAAQRWWYGPSAPGGRPAYLHPYSSGLDDSPVFDRDAILVSPDLTSYLVLADEILAGWLHERGRDAEAQECRDRAGASLERLLGTWDDTRGLFPSIGESGEPVAPETIVSLMPLLVDGLPEQVLGRLRDAVLDPERFGTPHPLPTVAVRDDAFAPERMWRGPVWVNTNWLVIHGLRRHGFAELADRLARATVELVAGAGPCEYFHPFTGEKVPSATTCFGWSAALAVDLAVALT